MLTAHEAWAEMHAMLECMETMPGWVSSDYRFDYYGFPVDKDPSPCMGLCDMLRVMHRVGLIDDETREQMKTTIEAAKRMTGSPHLAPPFDALARLPILEQFMEWSLEA